MRNNMLLSKDFTLMAIGQVISLFGNQMLRYALPLYLLSETKSSALFGTVLAFSFIPIILLFPIGGIIADRVNKRNIMVVLDFSTAVLITLFYVMVGRVSIVPLMAVTLIVLYGIQGVYQPAVKASVPALVNTEHIMQGNSVVDLISSLASMVGPVIGGMVYSAVGLPPILSISTGCFFASAIMELFIHIPFEKQQAAGNPLVTGLGDLKDSFRFLFRENPVLWKMSLSLASINLFVNPLLLIGVPVLITQRLGFPPDAASRLYGYSQGAIAAGAILGGLLAGVLSNKLTSRVSPFLLLGCGLLVFTGGIALQVLVNATAIYVALVICCSLLLALSTLFSIQLVTYVQIMTPKTLIGKVISCVMCVCMCTNPLGQFLYGIAFDTIGNRTFLPFYASALMMLVICIATRRMFHGIDRLLEKHAVPTPQ